MHRRVGKTGVAGILKAVGLARSIGLRADMDALPIYEDARLEHRSKTDGKMHACGHDGHTAMLLGTAAYLAETRQFDGTVTFIFQPGEEGCGGALAMLKDGLFDRFPCHRLYGLHNWTGLPVGTYAVGSGVIMAGGAFFDIVVNGLGAGSSQPENSVDPVLAACQLASSLQSIVSRNRPVAATSLTLKLGKRS